MYVYMWRTVCAASCVWWAEDILREWCSLLPHRFLGSSSGDQAWWHSSYLLTHLTSPRYSFYMSSSFTVGSIMCWSKMASTVACLAWCMGLRIGCTAAGLKPLFKTDFYFTCLSVLPACMSVRGCQILELQTAVNCHVLSAGIWTCVLWKSSKCS